MKLIPTAALLLVLALQAVLVILSTRILGVLTTASAESVSPAATV